MIEEDNAIPTQLPPPSPYRTLADVEVDIPNDARPMPRVESSPVEFGPLIESNPFEALAFSETPPQPEQNYPAAASTILSPSASIPTSYPPSMTTMSGGPGTTISLTV